MRKPGGLSAIHSPRQGNSDQRDLNASSLTGLLSENKAKGNPNEPPLSRYSAEIGARGKHGR